VYSRPDPWQVKVRAFYRVADGSEGSSFAFTHSSASTEAIIYAISGADTTDPVQPAPTQYSSGTGVNADTTLTAPGLTTPVDSSVVIFFGSCWNDMNTSPPSGTTPTFTEYYDGGSGGVFYSAAGVLSTAGATGDKSITIGANEYGVGCGLICIQASTGGGASAVPVFGRPGIMRGMLRHMQLESDWLKPTGGN